MRRQRLVSRLGCVSAEAECKTNFERLQDMALARSCLTLWVYRILGAHVLDPPITRMRRRLVMGAGRLDLGWYRGTDGAAGETDDHGYGGSG